jgi:iron complex transport system permease protein
VKTLSLVFLLPAVLVLALMLGSVPLAPVEIFHALWSGVSATVETPDDHRLELAQIILFQVRLPRVLVAAGAGAALSLAGLLMQTVFRNPLAGPGVLGVSAGAGLGVALVVLAGAGGRLSAPTVVVAVIGAGAVIVLMMIVHRVVGRPVVVLVLGLLLGYAAGALTSILMATSPAEGLEQYIIWSFGSFALPAGWAPTILLGMVFLCGAPLMIVASRMDALLLGAAYAESLGIHARQFQGLLLMVAGVLTGIVTAFTGPISFIGVAVPHLARGYLRTSLHNRLLPVTMIFGASLAILADLLARLPGSDRVLPLNAVLAIVGVPVVLMVILRPGGGTGSGGVEL